MASRCKMEDDTITSTPLLGRRVETVKARWSARHTLALMGFLGLTIEYSQRVCTSVVIVSMVSHSNLSQLGNNTNIFPSANLTNVTGYEGEFNWNKQTQGLILSAFFWGYLSTNLVGGRASEYIDGKPVFGLGIVASSLLSLICPIIAQTNVWLFVVCRVLMGAAQGVSFPSINCMLATWIIPADRSVFTTIVYSGFQIGAVVGLLLSGWLTFAGGWPVPFYLYGSVGVLWGVAWYFLIYERPENHPRLTPGERQQFVSGTTSLKVEKVIDVPVKHIITSLPFWAIMAVSFGNDFGFYTLLTELPTYLHDVQNFDIVNNGMLSSLPYMLMWVLSMIWALVMDYFTHKNKISLVTVRRLSVGLGMYGPSLGLIGMCFVDCNATAAIIALCVSGMLNGPVNCGFLCSPQDIAPNFAGTLLGLTNTIGALSGIIAPALTSVIVGNQGTLWHWRIVFLLSAVVYVISCTFYIKFISADVQPWNKPPIEEENLSTTEVQSSVENE